LCFFRPPSCVPSLLSAGIIGGTLTAVITSKSPEV
jgi:hypothetical protein